MTENELLVYEKIKSAVVSKKQISFWYKDTSQKGVEGWRLVEPHLIGEYKASGNIVLVGWFIADTTQQFNGMESKWGLYRLDSIDIAKLDVLDVSYKYTRKHYNPNDSRMGKIYCSTKLVEG